MNLTQLEQSELDLKRKRYRDFKLKHLSAYNFKTLQGPIRKIVISFLPPPLLSPWQGRGGGRGPHVGGSAELGVEAGARRGRAGAAAPAGGGERGGGCAEERGGKGEEREGLHGERET
jgi:hypothetical protein